VSAACRLGFIANFLSVLTGYLCGISLSLLASQIGRLTAVHIESPGLLRPLIEAGSQLHLIHIPTLVLGLTAFLILRMLKRAAPSIPGPVIPLVIGTLLSIIFDLQSLGIALLGPISSMLPSLTLQVPEVSEFDDFALNALGILVVSFDSGIITARSFGEKNRYRVDANRELIGLGAANIMSGLFGGFPVTGADSRTAVRAT
jgi:SulP family sulfate permease